MKSLKSQSGCALLKGPFQTGGKSLKIQSDQALVLEHTGGNFSGCYNTRIKLLEHTSVAISFERLVVPTTPDPRQIGGGCGGGPPIPGKSGVHPRDGPPIVGVCRAAELNG